MVARTSGTAASTSRHQLGESRRTKDGRSNQDASVPRLLVVGPLPPPPDGPSVSFQLFCDEARYEPGTEVVVIDSSPKRLKDDQTARFSSQNLLQAMRVLVPFIRRVWSVDRVLIFGGNRFLLTIGSLLILIAKLARKPCYLRVFGGSLDRYYRQLNPIFRRILLSVLTQADGVILQTELLRTFLRRLIGDSVHLVPGYRVMPRLEHRDPPSTATANLRLVFVGHVREAKGIFVLLESLRALSPSSGPVVHCDVFGPIYEHDAVRFEQELAHTDTATYRGILPAEEVVSTLKKYDALVLPTHYRGEGHPGVLVEAMMAGLPAITSDFRSIPELVTHRVNGLLIAPKDTHALAEAIEALHADRRLLAEMGKQNWNRRVDYDARHLSSLILRAVGIDAKSTLFTAPPRFQPPASAGDLNYTIEQTTPENTS